MRLQLGTFGWCKGLWEEEGVGGGIVLLEVFEEEFGCALLDVVLSC